MLKFFRKIRQKLLSENKFSKYLIYAIGEIILVVIGILIALQINNWNEQRNTREKELVYLNGIRNDLEMNIIEIDEFISNRKDQVRAANEILDHFNGKPVDDWNAFNMNTVSIYIWQRFFQIDNTFQELINSGNLAIISNEEIKNGLLNLDVLYKKLNYNEDHFRFDAEVTLYEPSYSMTDIQTQAGNYIYQLTGGQEGALGDVEKNANYNEMLQDQKQKNGFAFAVLEFSTMITRFEAMKEKCKEIIELIDTEMESE